MNIFFAAAIVALTLLLGACARPLQPDNYSERLSSAWLGANRFSVDYRGNSRVGDDKIADLALLRSAEIALQNGFPYFIVIDTDTPATADDGIRQAGNDAVTVQHGQRYRLADPGASNTIVGFESKPQGFAYVALFVKASLRAKYGLDAADSGI